MIMSKAKTAATPSRWKTQYNAKEYPIWGETNNLPSMVVPDMSMTIDEILARSTRGLSFEHMLRVPIYEAPENDDNAAIKNFIPNVTNWDLADQETYKNLQAQKALTARRRLEQIDRANKRLADKVNRYNASRIKEANKSEDEDTEDEPKTVKPSKQSKGGKA